MKEKELERIFKALGNRRRLIILNLLKTRKVMPVGEIARELKLSIKATSKHLLLLTAIDIVEKEQVSSQVFCRISSNLPKTVQIILDRI